MYYHWQKRTAEKHVSDEHPGQKIYVKDVRAEGEIIKKNKAAENASKKAKKNEEESLEVIKYQPYRCGLCDFAAETIEGIRDHCLSVHEIGNQFKCSLCDFSSDNKSEVEGHCKSSLIMRIFYVDPTSTSNLDTNTCSSSTQVEEKREPLWKRDMPGLKHIRGILYEEYPDMPYDYEIVEVPQIQENSKKKDKESKTVDEVDNFPMKCKECGLQKKTIKGLKMHIKLLHLRTGKFLCRRCQFSANMMNSINTHYKIKHPEAEKPDFEERGDEKLNFSHEFWKEEWNIPTLAERKALVKARNNDENQSENNPINPKKRKGRPLGGKGKKAKKKGVKRKLSDLEVIEEIPVVQPTARSNEEILSPEALPKPMETAEKPLNVMEISPFERVPTYKCQYCSKRSNILEKMDTHLKVDHANIKLSEENQGYKILTRDQVVDMLTLNLASRTGDFICYFCDDVVGSINEVKTHFEAEHDKNDTFKVKRAQDGKKPITGYLECQLCGYLSPGLDRSKQRVHFHDEHPLETSINCSKYVSKVKVTNTAMAQNTNSSVAFDPIKYIGMAMRCPKEDCTFENTSNAALNAHLRKHTQTFRCGHCGKTHPNSSEFHRHSAMIHGDK